MVNATVTGVAGPAQTVTAAVFTNGLGFTIDNHNENKLFIFTNNDGTTTPAISINAATTMTVTISGATFTVVIS